MPTSAEAVYLDSSALVKLVLREAESTPLTDFLLDRPWRVSSTLAVVEVVRAVRPHGPPAIMRAHQVLDAIDLVPMDRDVLDDAARLGPLTLRSLDAIHLAAARSLGSSVGRVVTYDRRLAMAARDVGLAVDAPGTP